MPFRLRKWEDRLLAELCFKAERAKGLCCCFQRATGVGGDGREGRGEGGGGGRRSMREGTE